MMLSLSQSLPSKAILSVKNRPTFDTQNSEELGAEDSEAEGALLEVESALVEVEDAVLEVESVLVEVEGALLEVESPLVEVDGALLGVESALVEVDGALLEVESAESALVEVEGSLEEDEDCSGISVLMGGGDPTDTITGDDIKKYYKSILEGYYETLGFLAY